MKDRILKDMVSAMKSQDKLRLSVLRMVKGAIQLEEINKKNTLTDDDVIGVLSKQIKTICSGKQLSYDDTFKMLLSVEASSTITISIMLKIVWLMILLNKIK